VTRAAPFLLCLAAAVSLSGCRRPAELRVTTLGIPPTERAVQASVVIDGTLYATLFETQGAAHVAAIDLERGGQVEVALPGTTGADALQPDPARGVLWIGTSLVPSVWRMDLHTREVRRIAALDPLLATERYVWSLALGPDGTLYAGTYPGGLLLAYDPATDRARSLGTPVPGRKYLRHLAVGASGTVYCSLGTPAAVAAVDPRRNAVTVVFDAPPTDDAPPFAGPLELSGGALVAPVPGGPARLAVRDQAAVAIPPGVRRVHVDTGGRYEVALGGRTARGVVDLKVRQDGMGVQAWLALGPDGNVYGATYYNASLFRVVTETGALEAMGRVAGADGSFQAMQAAGRRLILPGYSAELFVYDVDRPWVNEGEGLNPHKVGEIGHRQGLSESIAASGDVVAIATPPGYGATRGALTLLDTRTMTWTTQVGLAGDQRLSTVAFGPGGHVSLGSAVVTGLGRDAAEGPAHIVTTDAAGAVVRDIPVPGATAVTALVPLDGDRMLAGTDTGRLLEVGSTSGTVREVARLPHIRALRRWTAEGVIAGVAWRKGIFTVDPETLAVTWVPGTPDKLLPGIAEDAAGRLYVHDRTRLYRIGR
jgi:hypothetical protein